MPENIQSKLAELNVKCNSLFAEMEDAWREVDRAVRAADLAEEAYAKAKDEYDAENARRSANTDYTKMKA